MEFKIEFYGLNRKIESARRNGFVFNQINKLIIKVYGSLSNFNICYYLQSRILICQNRLFFELFLQNKEYVKTNCNDLNNLFHFACRK